MELVFLGYVPWVIEDTELLAGSLLRKSTCNIAKGERVE